jgi:hypothetical protein
MKITVNQIMKWGPCDDYPREKVKDLWGDRDALSWHEIAQLPIPKIDIWWALTRTKHQRMEHRLALLCLPENAPPTLREYLRTGDPELEGTASIQALSVKEVSSRSREVIRGVIRGVLWGVSSPYFVGEVVATELGWGAVIQAGLDLLEE